MIKNHIFRGVILFRLIPGFSALFLSLFVGIMLSSLMWMVLVIASYFLLDYLVVMKRVYKYLSKYSLNEYESYFCDHYQRTFDKYRIRKRVSSKFDVSKHLLKNKYSIIKNGLFYREYRYVAFDYIDPFLTFARKYSISVYTNGIFTEDNNRYTQNEMLLNYNVLIVDERNDSPESKTILNKYEDIYFDFVITISWNRRINIQRNFALKEIRGLEYFHNVKKQYDSFKSDQYLLISNFQRVCFIINKLF
jgi:hypothetical protein